MLRKFLRNLSIMLRWAPSRASFARIPSLKLSMASLVIQHFCISAGGKGGQKYSLAKTWDSLSTGFSECLYKPVHGSSRVESVVLNLYISEYPWYMNSVQSQGWRISLCMTSSEKISLLEMKCLPRFINVCQQFGNHSCSDRNLLQNFI